jgi:hypothetical protein
MITPDGVSRMRALLVLAAVALASGCTDKDGAKKALEQAGYKQVEIGGYAPFACSDSDTYATKFKAVGPTGIRVSGTVCAGMFFKGKTVRLD